MTNEEIIYQRMACLDNRHLCADCDRLFTQDGGCRDTTVDEHVCEYAYEKGVETVDNGGGYWVVKCPNYIKMDTRKIYDDWMKSDDWKRTAAEAKKRAGYQCQLCGSAINLCVHHITYDNLCREDIQYDLLVVCKTCHEKLHEYDISL